MHSIGYTKTKNANFFFTRCVGLIALGVAEVAWNGRPFLSHPHYLATLSVSTVAFGSWSHAQRAYGRRLGEHPLNGTLPEGESNAYFNANTFATSGVWDVAGISVIMFGSAYLFDRFAPQWVRPILLGLSNGMTVSMGTVQLWHLCLKPNEE